MPRLLFTNPQELRVPFAQYRVNSASGSKRAGIAENDTKVAGIMEDRRYRNGNGINVAAVALRKRGRSDRRIRFISPLHARTKLYDACN